MTLRPARAVDLLLLLCGVVFAAYALSRGSPYLLRVLSIAGIYALLAIGYQFIFGHAGTFSLAQGTFMGVGAYASAILGQRYGMAFDLGLPASIVLTVFVAALVAIPVLRLQTHYFALATLLISQIVLLVVTSWESFTGGANGLSGIDGLSFFDREVPPGAPVFFSVWVFVAVSAFLAWKMTRGLLSAAFSTLRVNRVAAEAIGIDADRLRFGAFLLSAAFGGLAGALYAHIIGVISPEVLSFPIMVTCLTIALVGGRFRLPGAILGAVLIIELPEWFRFLRDYYLVGYGIVLLLVIIAAPHGIVGLLDALAARLRRGARPPAPASIPLKAALFRPATGDGPLLELSGLAKRFGGVSALAGVSLKIRPGEVIGLIGPNGSGKTTLLNVVTGLYRADAGQVSFDGRDITLRRTHEIARAGIARTFQTVILVDDMTVLDNVAIGRAAGRVGFWRSLIAAPSDPELAAARAEAMTLLDRMGVAEVATLPAGVLAYGLRRRVEIARALALQPRLLLLDEPAAGLNETEQADLARRLRRIADEGCTLLVVEHNMPFLAPLADRFLCLDYGELIAEGTPAEVQRDRRVIEAYLGRGAELPA